MYFTLIELPPLDSNTMLDVSATNKGVLIPRDKSTRLMNMSRTNLFRKIKNLTNLTPNELINFTNPQFDLTLHRLTCF